MKLSKIIEEQRPLAITVQPKTEFPKAEQVKEFPEWQKMSEKEKPRNPQVDNMRLTKRKSKERRKFNRDLEQEVEVMSNLDM